MFGKFENFPKVVQGSAGYRYNTSKIEIQRIIIKVLYKINERKRINNISDIKNKNLKIKIDIGIADGSIFNYFDNELLKYYLKNFYNLKFDLLDFFCIICYYSKKNTKYKPLKFDYYILRIELVDHIIRIQIYHEKGPRRVSIEELITYITNIINKELKRKNINQITEIYTNFL